MYIENKREQELTRKKSVCGKNVKSKMQLTQIPGSIFAEK